MGMKGKLTIVYEDHDDNQHWQWPTEFFKNSVAQVVIINYYLLTGCKGRTRKYKPKVFHTARACEGCLENQGLVFLGTAWAPS